jgi:hypothetical protein
MKIYIQDGIIINGRMPQIIQLIDTIDSIQEALEDVILMKLLSQVFKQSKMKMKLTHVMLRLL